MQCLGCVASRITDDLSRGYETAGQKGWSVGTSACENRRSGRKRSNRKTKHMRKRVLGNFHPFSSFSASSWFFVSSCHTQLPNSISFGHNFIFGSLKSKRGIILLPIVTISLHRPIDDFALNLRLQLSTSIMVQGTQQLCAENPEPTRLLLQFDRRISRAATMN